ncbi:MAG TPA: hypothetical protein VLL75_14850 [Vicinamibacteria bacterium]|nr:hypothetical protein [Vicinamibacteria bacterium]
MSPLAALPLLALLLLPGLLVVRAPWTAVPALSLAFWALSAWWPPFATLGRGRLVAAALTAFVLLFLLRLLPKHEVPPPPGWTPPHAVAPPRPGLPPPPLASTASLLVLGASLALLVPLVLWRHAPGPRLAFQTTIARLLVWRDAVPATAEPLLPLSPVGAHAPALATLAADASRVSGLDPARSVLLVVALAAGLLLVGLFALHATWAPPWAAALGALVGLAAAPWPGALGPWGEGEGLLALGLTLPAASLIVGHSSRSSALAAGMLLAASALAQPVLAATVLATTVLVGRTVAAKLARRESRLRPALSGAVAVVLAAPGLYPLLRSLSLREAQGIAFSVRPHELLPFAFGLVLAAFAPLLFLRVRGSSPGGRVATALLAFVATILLVARVHGWIASGQLSVPVRSALARVAADTAPLASVCAPEGARDWVPALAERAAGEPGPWVPPVYADEWAVRLRRRCDWRLEAFVPTS